MCRYVQICADMPTLNIWLVKEVNVLDFIEIMTLLFEDSLMLFFIFLVWMYQGKKQRQEKEAKRFKGKEFLQ